MNVALRRIAAKVEAGTRLSREDGIALFKTPELLEVGRLADLVKRRRGSDEVYFVTNLHVNPSNICVNLCPLCAFAKKEDEAGAYAMTLEKITAKVEAAKPLGITEVHIVGGLYRGMGLEFYEEMLRAVKRIMPEVVIQAFTAVEVDYLSQTGGLPLEGTLARLQAAGLDSLPGGGAEVFAPRVRRRICPKKIGGERWLEIHATAHRLGMKTNATLLYGHIETVEERVEHLLALREQQERTGGFLTFIPLAFHPVNTKTGAEIPGKGTSGYDDLRTIAVSRLLLDNFPHVKAMWIQIGEKMAQVALSFGADDLDGTVMEEKIYHAAGATTPQHSPKDKLRDLILGAGKTPVERDTLYRRVGA